MKVYIAGPIAGMKDGNRKAFERAEATLWAAGWTPVNPHKLDHSHEGPCRGPQPLRYVDQLAVHEAEAAADSAELEHRYGCYMAADIRALLECDAIVFLPGWERSKGASLERSISVLCGIRAIALPRRGEEAGEPRDERSLSYSKPHRRRVSS